MYIDTYYYLRDLVDFQYSMENLFYLVNLYFLHFNFQQTAALMTSYLPSLSPQVAVAIPSALPSPALTPTSGEYTARSFPLCSHQPKHQWGRKSMCILNKDQISFLENHHIPGPLSLFILHTIYRHFLQRLHTQHGLKGILRKWT